MLKEKVVGSLGNGTSRNDEGSEQVWGREQG